MPEIKQDIRTATIVVASNTSLHKNDADYVCSGVNDHLELNAAIIEAAALGGAEVCLLEGIYYMGAPIVLDSCVTLRGQGRGTVLTAATLGIDIITAIGGPGTEKTGILVADLCIDGDLGGTNSGNGIQWRYVDDSKIVRCWILDADGYASLLLYCDHCEIAGNTVCNCEDGIGLVDGVSGRITNNDCSHSRVGEGIGAYQNEVVVADNTCHHNFQSGIVIGGTDCVVDGNATCDNDSTAVGYPGIYVSSGSDRTAVSGNTCGRNGRRGILIHESSFCSVTGNTCHNQITQDGIEVLGTVTGNADYNTLTGNTCTANPGNGIEIAGGANANKNIVAANQLLGNTGASFADGGTLTEIGHNITV